jgi:hypothetical protein
MAAGEDELGGISGQMTDKEVEARNLSTKVETGMGANEEEEAGEMASGCIVPLE